MPDRPNRAPRRATCWLALALATGLAATPGRAASLQRQDIDILGRALAFLDPAVPAGAIVAIVYAADDPASRRDAEALLEQFGPGLATASGVLPARLVESSTLAGGQYGLIVAAAGAPAGVVAAAARAQHVLCVTGDVAAVQAGTCTLALRSAGRVEILLNRDAASQSGQRFTTAFRIMVHEL